MRIAVRPTSFILFSIFEKDIPTAYLTQLKMLQSTGRSPYLEALVQIRHLSRVFSFCYLDALFHLF